jgi:hypothetical protein
MRRKMMKKLGVILLVGFIFTGCGWLKRVIEGTVTLEDEPVTGIKLMTASGVAEVCPGEVVQLKVIAEIEGKEPLSTWVEGGGKKKGHLTFEDFDFSSNFGQVSEEEGMLKFANTGLNLLNQTLDIHVASKHKPEHTSKTSLQIRFGCPVELGYSGASGYTGESGNRGSNGSSGKNNQSTGSHASPGGHGRNGANGGPGGRGGSGENGHNLTVDLAKIQDGNQIDLVLIKVTDHSKGNAVRTVLLDPQTGGRATIYANGGSGGNGGKGGDGGYGGGGGTGAPKGDGGDGGDGGNGGDGGDAGDGGRVDVRYDHRHNDLLKFLTVHNKGGQGGASGSGGFGGSGGNGNRSGSKGNKGYDSKSAGRNGRDGPAVRPKPVPLGQLFPELKELNFV